MLKKVATPPLHVQLETEMGPLCTWSWMTVNNVATVRMARSICEIIEDFMELP